MDGWMNENDREARKTSNVKREREENEGRKIQIPTRMCQEEGKRRETRRTGGQSKPLYSRKKPECALLGIIFSYGILILHNLPGSGPLVRRIDTASNQISAFWAAALLSYAMPCLDVSGSITLQFIESSQDRGNCHASSMAPGRCCPAEWRLKPSARRGHHQHQLMPMINVDDRIAEFRTHLSGYYY